jgi:hypothetical protein
VRVCGAHFHDLPKFGALRILSGDNQNSTFNYSRKFMFPTTVTEGTYPTSDVACDSIVLAGSEAFPGAAGDVVELLHQEYNSTAVRVEFTYDEGTGLVQLQFKVGTLDMSIPYEDDDSDDIDDYIRGMAPGYAVSAVYSQAGPYTGVGTQPNASPDGFVVYDGGVQIGGDEAEYWNRLEIMLRDGQLWIWWNGLLIPPNTQLSAGLDTPVAIDTPYFPVAVDNTNPAGKIGLRMWPGALLRRVGIKSQVVYFSEFTYGGVEIV